jgi:hypothetical protein
MTTKETISATLKKDLEELARLRDEIRVKVHLAGLDAKSAWGELEPRLSELERDARDQGDAVKTATVALAEDVRKAFVQFRERLG